MSLLRSSLRLASAAAALPVGFATAQHTTTQRTSAPASAARAAVPAPGKHMLFRATGPKGATVYLLGSVHLLTADAAVLPDVVDSAFAHAKSVIFETSLDSVMMRGQEIMMRGQYKNGATLKTSLSPAAVAKLDSILPEYGLAIDQVNALKPWLVSLAMTQMIMQRAGFQPQYGVDEQLNARARAAGKPVGGLESVDFQLGLFDALTPADQERMLLETRAPDVEAKDLMLVKDAWVAGNTTALDSLLNSRMSSSPGLVATLVTNRNKSWIPKLETMLNGSDDALVVVGAGHLVGKQGVVELLRAKGYKVEQM